MKIPSLFFCFLITFLFSSLSPLLAEPASEVSENISTENYCAFLNAVESTSAHGFYHPEMGTDRILQSLAEDGVHLIYSLIGNSGALPITSITPTDAFCFSNWVQHGCPTGDAVTEEVLYTAVDQSIQKNTVSFKVADLAPAAIEAASTRQNHQRDHKNDNSSDFSYFYNGLKAVGSTAEWTVWNIGGEVVEAIVFQQCGLYALAPYCLYMGSVIFHEYENGEYWAAAGTILHALFDIACMLGDRIGFNVAGILGDALEKCGLKCVADFFEAIHAKIDWLLHTLGIEHSHGMPIENDVAAAPVRQETAESLENFANDTSSETSTAVTTAANSSVPGAGWTTHRHHANCKHQ